MSVCPRARRHAAFRTVNESEALTSPADRTTVFIDLGGRCGIAVRDDRLGVRQAWRRSPRIPRCRRLRRLRRRPRAGPVARSGARRGGAVSGRDTGADRDARPAPSPKPTGAAAERSTTRRQAVPAAPPRRSPRGGRDPPPSSARRERRHRLGSRPRRSPARDARRATTTRRAGAHAKRCAPPARGDTASPVAKGERRRRDLAAPGRGAVFPTVVSAPALSAHTTRRPPERPLALAGGALLALVVASCGLLVLTARGERERIGT